MIWILPLAVLGLVVGRFRLPTYLGWLVIVGLLSGVYFALLGADPIVRMVGICVVLLTGMKSLVYTAWGGHLPWGRHLVFTMGWFGMDPGTFKTRREDLSWKEDVGWGVGMMVLGTMGAWVVWMMGWRQILVMFLPMSIGFHFGALRVLKGALRRAGFPVRTLFPNLLKARGVADFWSRRWNVGYSQMMQRVVGRPIESVLGREAGIFGAFLVSGLLHEVAITLPVNSGYGLPTAFFAGHGFLVLLEGKLGRPLGRVPALLAVALPLGFLFPPEFQSEVIERCLHIFGLLT
jgi:hypothetical protein